jgi:hypothetical protein
MATFYNNAIFGDGIVACFDAESPKSYGGTGSTWSDVGGGNDGTITGATFVGAHTTNYIGLNGSSSINYTDASYAAAFGTEDFTVEFWIYNQHNNFYSRFMSTSVWNIELGNGKTSWQNSSYNFNVSGPSNNVWTHVAFTREGTNLKLFYNGTQQGTTVTDSTNYTTAGGDVSLGNFLNPSAFWHTGLVSNLRMSRGIARYTASGFTPPQGPLEADAYTTFLIGQAAPFSDNSINGYSSYIESGTPTETKTANYFDFNGSNNFITLSSDPDIVGVELTFSVWNYGVDLRASSVIYLANSSGNRVLNVHLPWSDSNVYFDAGNGSGAYNRIFKNVSSSEYQGWHNWVFTKNASTGQMKIYLDGTLWHSGTGLTQIIGTPNGAKYIGSSGLNFHRGRIGVLHLYNRELSATEITHNFNVMRGRYGI